MSVITIRLSEDMMVTVKTKANELGVSTGEYIRRAVVHMNNTLEEDAKKARMIRASYLTREESMKINAEFDAIVHEIRE